MISQTIRLFIFREFITPPMSTLLERLGIDINPDAVRAALVRSGVAVKPRLASYVSRRKTATHYLDGEEQRVKKELLAQNEHVIVGRILRGVPINQIASDFGVTDMAIYKRAKKYGLIGDRRLPVDGLVTKKKWLGIKIHDYHAEIQATPDELQTGQLFLFGVNGAAPTAIAKSLRLGKYPNVGKRVALKLKSHVQVFFDYVW